jgi:phosphoglucomutase
LFGRAPELTALSLALSPASHPRALHTIHPIPPSPHSRPAAARPATPAPRASSTLAIVETPTTPIPGQKTGTSGLRKKTKEFAAGTYLANWVQSLFDSLGPDTIKGAALGLGGDGRYFNSAAAQTIIKHAAAAGFGKVVVGKNAIMATPAMSALIRRRGLYGGLVMSASHNPGGPDEDWGIKFNASAGQPAPEKVTDAIYGFTQSISTLRAADLPDVDLSKVGVTKFGDAFEVEVVDPVADYLATLREVFDFDAIRSLIARPDFTMVFDAMHAVTGAYAGPILVDALGADPASILNGTPKEDFGGGHPDPNLTYAAELVARMWAPDAPVFGAASDGDGDRNMILGARFFVSPADSVAVIAANAAAAIPYFKGGLKGVARSMPTSGALDRVAADLGVPFFEVPTGWKFFGNLMDAGKCSVCGEESFGTGSDHVREKDGLWAVLAWLSILAHANKDTPPDGPLVGVGDVVRAHWAKYGRNFFSRYDYEGVDSDAAAKMVDHLRGVIASAKPGDAYGPFTLATADDFAYTDPVDGSVSKNQGIRFVFTDGSRIIFRLSGTGSAGATVRLYVEQYAADGVAAADTDAQAALAPIIKVALETSRLPEFTGRDKPTVIT